MKQKCQHSQLMKENKMKEKAIEICKNLTQTINNMTPLTNTVESKSTVYESIRVKKSILIRRKKELMDQYNLTEKNLK